MPTVGGHLSLGVILECGSEERELNGHLLSLLSTFLEWMQ